MSVATPSFFSKCTTPAKRRDLPVLADEEGVQLVAVEIAEVAGVEAVAALARRAFVGAAELERLLVDRVDLLLARRGERDHHAVADRCGLAVERLGDRDHRPTRRPADEL